ncbi:glycosyltransferase family 2 protein [Corallibacter sp.]|uniref:glycosyltransferase family 2 protein n=1 Tax=Corallibacter sp. TaxID=2038084 RepID=UPI003A95C97C
MKISVYITSYNQKDFLREAIDSVLNQTLQPFEIIIVDDASTDGSQDLIKSYASKYVNIRYVFHDKNKGVSQVRITALNEIKGDYVTYLDGDDLYLPHKLEVESDLIAKSKCDLAFSNNMYVKEDDPKDIKWIWAANNISVDSNVDLFYKTISRDFPRDSLFRMELINYEKLKQVGFHDPNLKIYEDYDLRIRLAKELSFTCSIEPTSKIRISKNGLSKLPLKNHLISLNYILNKYKNDIDQLDKVKKEKLLIKIEDFKKGSTQNLKGNRLKARIKNKLINIIKRF